MNKKRPDVGGTEDAIGANFEVKRLLRSRNQYLVSLIARSKKCSLNALVVSVSFQLMLARRNMETNESLSYTYNLVLLRLLFKLQTSYHVRWRIRRRTYKLASAMPSQHPTST